MFAQKSQKNDDAIAALASTIRNLRESKGWSQSKLAGELGLTDSYISKLEGLDKSKSGPLPSYSTAHRLDLLTNQPAGTVYAMVEAARRAISHNKVEKVVDEMNRKPLEGSPEYYERLSAISESSFKDAGHAEDDDDLAQSSFSRIHEPLGRLLDIGNSNESFMGPITVNAHQVTNEEKTKSIRAKFEALMKVQDSHELLEDLLNAALLRHRSIKIK